MSDDEYVTVWGQDPSYIVRWGEIIRRADYSCGLFGAAVSAHPNESSYCYRVLFSVFAVEI